VTMVLKAGNNKHGSICSGLSAILNGKLLPAAIVSYSIVDCCV